MVILQFNKLIRNKWVWGAFAVVVSAAFCFDDLFRDGRDSSRPSAEAGVLAGENISADEFTAFRQETLGFGRARTDGRTDAEINLETWKAIAADRVAAEAGVVVSDAVLENAIISQFSYRGGFNYDQYKQELAQNFSITPERYEYALRHLIARNQGVNTLLAGSGAFVSPMELDVMVADATDTFDVRVARFTQSREKADAVTIDEEGLKKWYDENIKKLTLPERIKIRYVRYNAADTNVLARMTVTEDDLHDYYDSSLDRFTSTDTNGVETVKTFEEVQDEIEKELRKIAAVEYFTTNLQRRAYADFAEGEDVKASRLDRIAAEDGMQVVESDWFSLDGGFVEGFMRRAESIAPGSREFTDRVAELDPDVPDLRYGIVSSDNAVWLLERSAISEAHTPAFEEAKGHIDNQALRDAKAAAFKAEIEEIAKGGADVVLATGDVSTNIVFSLVDMPRNSFPDQAAVARAATKLKTGEVSEFVPTSSSRGLLVVCIERKQGDPLAVMNVRDDLRRQAAMTLARSIAAKWDDANLAAMNLVPGTGYEISETPEEDSAEEPESAE